MKQQPFFNVKQSFNLCTLYNSKSFFNLPKLMESCALILKIFCWLSKNCFVQTKGLPSFDEKKTREIQFKGTPDRGLNLARVRTLGLTAGPRSLHPDQSENLSGVLIRVARAKIRLLSPSFKIIRASDPRPRLRPVKLA